MLPTERIAAFVKLGEALQNIPPEEKESLTRRAENQNNWFTPESVDSALAGIAYMLTPEKLQKWLSAYELAAVKQPKAVGLMLAGNIPAVGFHDLMCVLLAGHKACLKLSSSDEVLMKWIVAKLIEIDQRFESQISLEEMLKAKDAYIATGSDNSSRYFNYYFGKYPHVIRQNRTSVAVLSGAETVEDFQNLGKDIFKFYGLGCRNVSKLYVKSEENLQLLLHALEMYSGIAAHHKYHNNYDYNKSIYLVNGEKHLDNGFLLLRESEDLVSPISVLNYELYQDLDQLYKSLDANASKIQCMVGNPDYIKGAVPFGAAQHPEPWDYADGVDTLAFLLKL
ncbi:acyl-CoA reductase [Algoriphagus halophytocola]|uniref:Acyl-CoA reductase n=1 Tax=Algoriphagus halophytocola TaxID=2991499 RepID=A0ABY6MLH5_9BACT|nr:MULTISPECIES: acyl-CoA reductase [unclassified Algoriphagus]UZD24028.1 acyl-CoA reductase [Algoriphagus sp. TR-M5]WBL41400.1 acyl-CoA reductase [Algoriphagus sp. TR-M9]